MKESCSRTQRRRLKVSGQMKGGVMEIKVRDEEEMGSVNCGIDEG